MGASETLGACLRDCCLGKRFQIHCRDLDGRWITLNYVASTTSVRMLKFMLHCKTRLPPEDCVLVYGSKLLQPDKTLASSGITKDAGLQVLGRLLGGVSIKGYEPFGGLVQLNEPFYCLCRDVNNAANTCREQRGYYGPGKWCQPAENKTSRTWQYICFDCVEANLQLRERLNPTSNHYANVNKPWPATWAGQSIGRTYQANRPFPCIAPHCSEHNVWHPVGTVCQGFRDDTPSLIPSGRDQMQRWQHACANHAHTVPVPPLPTCDDTSRCCGNAPRPSSSSVASSSTRPLQCADPYATFEYTELELATARSMELGKPAHQQGEQLLEDTEVSEGSHDKVLEDLAKSNEKDSQQMPLREDEIEEGSTAPVSRGNALTHAQERALGFYFWKDIRSVVWRPTRHGGLRKPQSNTDSEDGSDVQARQSVTSYLGTLRQRLPALPFLEPGDPTAAARNVFAKYKTWTDEAKSEARDCFLRTANRIQGLLVMPEVTHREEMSKHAQFHVDGDPFTCKLPCPSCKTNKFILPADVNVDTQSSRKFVYGANSATMVFSFSYHCLNPECDKVKKKHRNNQPALTKLASYGNDGGILKSGLAIKDLKRLGKQFYGHDLDVIMQLPEQVGMLRRKTASTESQLAVRDCVYHFRWLRRCVAATRASCVGSKAGFSAT